jgi:hypothetical protein
MKLYEPHDVYHAMHIIQAKTKGALFFYAPDEKLFLLFHCSSVTYFKVSYHEMSAAIR